MKELEATLTLRNNRLKQLRLEAGYSSQVAFADAVGVRMERCNGLETLRLHAQRQDGSYTDAALLIAGFFGVDVEWLFSEGTQTVERRRTIVTFDKDEFQQLTAALVEPVLLPEEAAQQNERADVAMAAFEQLEPREQLVLKRRFSLDGRPGETRDALAISLGFTGERVKQIELRALKRWHDKVGREVLMED